MNKNEEPSERGSAAWRGYSWAKRAYWACGAN